MMQRSVMPADDIEDNLLSARAEANQGLHSFVSAAGVQPDRKIVQPVKLSVSDTILEAARKARADLIVIGTHGRTGIEKFFLGSMAEEVLRYAEMDVLVIPSLTRRAGMKPTEPSVAG